MTNSINAGPYWNRLLYMRDLRDRCGIKSGRPLMELVRPEDFPSETAPREHLTSDNLRLDTMRPVDPGDDAA
ncbi:MAG: hypothetical protein VX464_20745 [Pseudomonadota bacterium]|nr:hypothetical protein [Pseudomonadota bacterium]